MSEDDEFDLLELRLRKQKENKMNNPTNIAEAYNLQAHKEAIEERRGSIEHEVKAANAKQVAGEHYMRMDIEPWNVIDTWPMEQRIGFYRGNALKYIMRCGSKDERLQEIQKAGHYIEKLIEVIEND
jgi:hypothetical protein